MRRRTLTREEKALWAHIQRSVAPFPGRRLEPAPADPQPPSPPVFSPPPLVAMDRRALRKVKSGRRDIDGVLDLHGMTQSAAHDALNRFLHRKQREGASLVVVITGKGAGGSAFDPDRERGVLRRMAPHWLRMPDLRPLVLGFEAAAAHHGGDGALYVRLRRARGAFEP